MDKKRLSNILVVDQETAKGEAVANVFKAHASGIEVFLYDGKSKQNVSTELPCDFPCNIDMLVVHNRYIGLLEDFDLNFNQRLKPIRYTGGNPPGEGEKPNEIWIRKRSLRKPDDAPTKREVQEIIEWGNHILAEEENLLIPSLFVLPRVVRYLPALAILCQGYLAVQAASEGSSIDSLTPALKKMGWFDLGDEIKIINRELSNKKGKVESANWWLTPFGLENLEATAQGWREFENALINEEKEAGEDERSTIKEFIRENLKQGKFDSPKTIANVYCTLVSILDR